MGRNVFACTPLKDLDLSACAGINIEDSQINSLVELWLPFEGFPTAAKAFLPGSWIEVLWADVGEAEIDDLFHHVAEWGLDKLRIASLLVGEVEWQRVREPVLVELTDPVAVTTTASVRMTAWRLMPLEWEPFLRVIDISGSVIDLLPRGATLKELTRLEIAILPTVTGLRVLPLKFFGGCWRLSVIGTSCTALEMIEDGACDGCRSLTAFAFPPTIREVGNCVRGFPTGAFGGTSITSMDLSKTMAQNVVVCEMVFVVELFLPRHCVLEGVRIVPSLRRVTFGASRGGRSFLWHPTEVRFDSLKAESDFSPGLLEARVYGEVACEMGHETLPFPPP
jgi:hypothetical protein